ncbi:MAG TPA: hypothetical protein VIM99_14520 [Blastocatellia bacterium]
MSIEELAIVTLIHFVIPASGLGLYWRLRGRMIEAGIARPPIVHFFVLFATYGGWLLVGLTSLLWRWSGMATLGLAYLMFIAPIIMLALALLLYKQRNLSLFHFGAFAASAVYILLPAGVAIYIALKF